MDNEIVGKEIITVANIIVSHIRCNSIDREDLISVAVLAGWKYQKTTGHTALVEPLNSVRRYMAMRRAIFRYLTKELKITGAEKRVAKMDATTSDNEKLYCEDLLKKHANDLSVIQKQIIDLHYWQGKSIREIAKEINMDKTTIHRHLQTALETLRK